MKEFVNVFPEIVVLRRREIIGNQGWEDIYQWSKDHGIELIFKNHWHDETGHCYSFDVGTDEKKRTWFILRWS